VYSRCTRSIRFDFPTPNPDSRRYGCDLYRYSFTSGRESAIARASSGGDETWPAIWRSRIAFVRTYPGRRGRAGTVQHLLWRSLGARGRARGLRRPSPVITVRESSREGTTVERVRLPFLIEGLDLRGRTAAYTWKRVDDFDTVSFVYLSTTGGDLRPAARGATFGGGAADTSRTLRDASLGADGVDWLFESRGAPHYFGAFLQRRAGGAVRRSPSSKAVAFARDADAAYWIDGSPGRSSSRNRSRAGRSRCSRTTRCPIAPSRAAGSRSRRPAEGFIRH
jgi:hypothetical protein